jgi:hypothetical protein
LAHVRFSILAKLLAHRIAKAQRGVMDQSELLEAIGKATFTRGFGPFDARLRALGLAVKGETGKAPATTSPRPLQPLSPQDSLKSGSSGLPPRQLAAHAFLGERRRIRDLVDGITAATMGARVKKEELEKELKKLEKEL